MSMPVKVDGDTVVTFGDVAMLQRTFKDPTGFARINGEPALVLEVSKRSGANIIETIAQVRQLIEEAKPQLPDSLEIRYIMDQSEEVDQELAPVPDLLSSAQNLSTNKDKAASICWESSLADLINRVNLNGPLQPVPPTMLSVNRHQTLASLVGSLARSL
jgi:hypothetical protein